MRRQSYTFDASKPELCKCYKGGVKNETSGQVHYNKTLVTVALIRTYRTTKWVHQESDVLLEEVQSHEVSMDIMRSDAVPLFPSLYQFMFYSHLSFANRVYKTMLFRGQS